MARECLDVKCSAHTCDNGGISTTTNVRDNGLISRCNLSWWIRRPCHLGCMVHILPVVVVFTLRKENCSYLPGFGRLRGIFSMKLVKIKVGKLGYILSGVFFFNVC